VTPTPITLPQSLILLALSRGQQPYMPPISRLALVKKRWIVVDGAYRRRDGSAADRYALTSAGRQALATSKYLDEATRKLDAGKESRPWQGVK
jgi:hypothetical protein